MLVLTSLAAIVLAMAGLGIRPVQIKIGRSPWSGVMVGHATADLPEPGSAKPALGTASAIAAARISDVVLNVGFTPRSSSGCLHGPLLRGDAIRPCASAPEIYSGVIMTKCQDDEKSDDDVCGDATATAAECAGRSGGLNAVADLLRSSTSMEPGT